MTTNTPDTTRLTDEQVQESLSWLSRAQQAESHTVAVALWANTYGHQLHAHITTLAAELARVEAENERYREALGKLAASASFPSVLTTENGKEEIGMYYTIHDATAIARSALDGGGA